MLWAMIQSPTLKERKLFKSSSTNQYVIYLQHDNYTECCTLKQTEKGVRLDKTFKLRYKI